MDFILLDDVKLEDPSSLSKEYFRYAMREVAVFSSESSKNVLPITM